MVDIVIIAHSHPAINYGGGEVAAHRQFQYMKSMGYDVAFVGACVSGEESAKYLGSNQFVAEIAENDFLIRSDGMHHFFLEQDSLETEESLVKFLSSFQASIYHFHHIWNIGVGTLRKLKSSLPDAKTIYTLHEMLLICANHGQMIKSQSNALCREAQSVKCATCVPEFNVNDHHLRSYKLTKFLNTFDHLVSPSEFIAQRFREWGVKADIAVIENGVPFEQARDISAIDSARLSKKFAFFGRSTPTKGLDILVRAADFIEFQNKAAAQAVGEQRSATPTNCEIDVFGTTRADFEASWPEIPIPRFVRFHGPYTPDQVIGLMQKHGRIIMPSVWWENSPVIIQEAKAAQRPMIMSNIGGMAEKGEGWSDFFQVGDVTGLAEKIQDLAGDVEQFEQDVAGVPPPFSMNEFMDLWERLTQFSVDLGLTAD